MAITCLGYIERDTQFRRVSVRFPSGAVAERTALAPNQTVLMEETAR